MFLWSRDRCPVLTGFAMAVAKPTGLKKAVWLYLQPSGYVPDAGHSFKVDGARIDPTN
jgi:hypothetical protein